MDQATPGQHRRPRAPLTRLGRNVARGPGRDAAEAPTQDRRRRHSHDGSRDSLRDVILGGQDGLVNILGIILGVVAGGGGRTVLISAGSRRPSPSPFRWAPSATPRRPRIATTTRHKSKSRRLPSRTTATSNARRSRRSTGRRGSAGTSSIKSSPPSLPTVTGGWAPSSRKSAIFILSRTATLFAVPR